MKLIGHVLDTEDGDDMEDITVVKYGQMALFTTRCLFNNNNLNMHLK